MKVRRIISCNTLKSFAAELIEYATKHPDAKLEGPADISEERGFTEYRAVLNYDRRD